MRIGLILSNVDGSFCLRDMGENRKEGHTKGKLRGRSMGTPTANLGLQSISRSEF